MNWALNPFWQSSLLAAMKSARASSCLPNSLISLNPVKLSWTTPLRLPREFCCFSNRGWDFFTIILEMTTEPMMISMEARAIFHWMENIMATARVSPKMALSIWAKLCCRALDMVSMSLVTRLMVSPRGCWSK